MSFDSDEHSFTFRFHSAEGERDLEMNCNALYVGDILSFVRDFLQGCGYQIDGTIEVVPYETYEEETPKQDNFSMDHLPNNGWSFGMGQSVQALSTADIQAIKPIDPSYIKQYPTMAPLTTEQVHSWSAELPTQNGGKVRVGF